MRYLSEMFEYRDLFLVFIWREFSIRYKQSIIGILWAILQPLSLMLLFLFIFTFVTPMKISSTHPALFFYSALLPWTFFSSSINYAVPSLVSHYNLVTKIYFPREILPLSGLAVAAIDFILASIVLVVLMFVYGAQLTVNMLWFFPLVFLLIMFTIAICLILSALNVYFRDVSLAINFLLQLWFFASPVFYTIDTLPDKYKILFFINPLTFIIENIRRCLIEGRAVIWWQYIVMFCLVAIILLLCLRFFKSMEKKFADVI